MKTKRITIDCDPTDYEIIKNFAYDYSSTLAEMVHVAIDLMTQKIPDEIWQAIEHHRAEDIACKCNSRNRLQ